MSEKEVLEARIQELESELNQSRSHVDVMLEKARQIGDTGLAKRAYITLLSEYGIGYYGEKQELFLDLRLRFGDGK